MDILLECLEYNDLNEQKMRKSESELGEYNCKAFYLKVLFKKY